MKLQTNIPFQKQVDHQIDYQSKLLLLGSCFVENIGQKLAYFKFQGHYNPFGVLFHPKAIETLVLRAINTQEYKDDEVFFFEEQWHCFDVHSQMSHSSKIHLLAHLNDKLQSTRQQLEQASHLIITLGTAWVYKHYETNRHVANCHKVPQRNFEKQILSISDITAALGRIYKQVKAINPTVVFILTVSPIRHLKDGFVENNRSKAHLLAAIHEFIAQRSVQDCFYFPSYEIMMDELRDYRFYADDMLHPNQTAINYIWKKFQKVWLAEHTATIMDDIDAIQKGMAHVPFNPNSEAHIKFLKQLESRKEALNKKLGRILF